MAKSPPVLVCALRVAGMDDGRYLTIFGQYIIKPEIFELIENEINANLRQGGEFQLTSALEFELQAWVEGGSIGVVADDCAYQLSEHYRSLGFASAAIAVPGRDKVLTSTGPRPPLIGPPAPSPLPSVTRRAKSCLRKLLTLAPKKQHLSARQGRARTSCAGWRS